MGVEIIGGPAKSDQQFNKLSAANMPSDYKLAWKPFGKLLAVKVYKDASGDTKAGGIIIPETANWECPQYLVVGVGPECLHTKVGDIILLSPEMRLQIVRHAEDETLIVHEDRQSGRLFSKEEIEGKYERESPKLPA